MSSLASSVSSASDSTDSTGIVRNSNFDLGNIQFGAPKVNASGGKNVPLYNVSAKKGLTLQTPLMLTWGVNECTDDNSGRKTYDMSLQFPTPEYANTNTTQFLENMMALEHEKITEGKKYLITQVELWRGDKIYREMSNERENRRLFVESYIVFQLVVIY